jgi:hypothetical protein
LDGIAIVNSTGVENGAVRSTSEGFYISISNSSFISNTGINGEADLNVIKFSSFEVSSTTFTLFSSSTNLTGLSISIEQDMTGTIYFDNVIVK